MHSTSGMDEIASKMNDFKPLFEINCTNHHQRPKEPPPEGA
jgi:hypothetical protein